MRSTIIEEDCILLKSQMEGGQVKKFNAAEKAASRITDDGYKEALANGL